MRFILDALTLRGCRIAYSSDPREAPFYVVFETPGGEYHGLLAYAFFANTRVTRNRPKDEHRFQIKYGGNFKGVLDVAIDPRALVTTIFLGIDVEHGIFIAADPLMNAPSPMSRSVEFKREHVGRILDEGWFSWERDRHSARTRNRAAYVLSEDVRTEVLVGARQERLLDLIVLERIAHGLDPGERHLVADKLKVKPEAEPSSPLSHTLLDELEIAPEALLDLIHGASRLKMAVRGWVAEAHLYNFLCNIPGVTECARIEMEGKPDISLRWKGKALHARGYRYRLHSADLPGKPDIVFRSRKSVIFVHGCFWHQHPHPKCPLRSKPRSNIGYWNAKLARNVERDAEHRTSIRALGWRGLVIWECEASDQKRLQRKLDGFLKGMRP